MPSSSDFSAQTVADQTADFLRHALRAGRWQESLPSERVLAVELRVSRPTLRKAMQILEREKWLARSRGHSRQILKQMDSGASREKSVVLLARPDDHLKNWHSMRLVETIRGQLAAEGVRLELFVSEKLHGAKTSAVLEKLVHQYAPQAWILFSQADVVQRWFAERGLRTVVLGSAFPGVSLPFVDIDRRASCRHAVGVFARLGHRRLCYFSRRTGAAGDYLSEQVVEESRSHFEGIDINALGHDGTAEQIWKLAHRWKLQGANRPTALLVSHSDDALTLGVELLRIGIRVPQEVSIISRDSDPVFERIRPRIASYLFDPSRHARVLCRILHGETARGQLLIAKFDKGESLASPPLEMK